MSALSVTCSRLILVPLALLLAAGCHRAEQAAARPQAPGASAPIPGIPLSSAAVMPGMPTEAQIGLPFYPQARVAVGPDRTPEAVKTDQATLIVLETADSPDKVLAFYQQHLPHAQRTDKTLNAAPDILLSQPSPKGGYRAVEIHAEEGVTRIQLMNMRASRAGKGLFLPKK
ncbi:MAG TPA: hypothetical protein VFA07_07105 [Chthonomonadaceae bacterium]|nr:hypothetical protein [Chthonomonadaceae bacterium]